jgi:heme o synthase
MAVGARPIVPSRLAPGGVMGHERLKAPRSKAGAYLALTKPRIIELLLITTLPTMVVAAGEIPSVWLMFITLVGGALAAGGANAVNMYVDRDIDKLMPRTQNRPLVTGAVTPKAALVFALVLEAVAFAVLWSAVNLLSAVLALSAMLFYVFVYTIWLKRTSTRNIVIGGAAGAVPVLVGWSSVTGSLGLAPWVLFATMFFWTPPHFWALAIRYADDYRAASVPMLPAVADLKTVSRRMLFHTTLMVACSLWFWAVADLGWLYGGFAVVLGGLFLAGVIDLGRRPSAKRSMRLFAFSITYVTLLFLAMAADVVVRN